MSHEFFTAEKYIFVLIIWHMLGGCLILVLGENLGSIWQFWAPQGQKPQIFSQGQVAHTYFLLSCWKTTLFLSKTTKKVMCTLWPSEIFYLENWLRWPKSEIFAPPIF